MKSWISRSPNWYAEFVAHADEPQPKELSSGHLFWDSDHSVMVCTHSLHAIGFSTLPGNDECCEYDLSGKKPQWVCTWAIDDGEAK